MAKIQLNGKHLKIRMNLSIKDLTGAGDLFASGFLHGNINNLSSI